MGLFKKAVKEVKPKILMEVVCVDKKENIQYYHKYTPAKIAELNKGYTYTNYRLGDDGYWDNKKKGSSKRREPITYVTWVFQDTKGFKFDVQDGYINGNLDTIAKNIARVYMTAKRDVEQKSFRDNILINKVPILIEVME